MPVATTSKARQQGDVPHPQAAPARPLPGHTDVRESTSARRPPPAGAPALDRVDLVDLVRPPEHPPCVDHGLAGGLRAWLEDAAAVAAPIDGPLRARVVDRRSLLDPEEVASQPTAAAPTLLGSIRDELVAIAFRQVLTAGTQRRPFEAAVAGALVLGRDCATARLGGLGPTKRRELRSYVERASATISRQWRPMPTSWFPRTGERLRAPLAGGAVVLAAHADLVVGSPSRAAASVCIVQVAAGSPGVAHQRGRQLAAVIETLRSGVPPWRVATYYPAQGKLDIDDFTDQFVADAVVAVCAAVKRHRGTSRAA